MIDQEAFLQQEIELASPAKLRWLLLRKAHGLCPMIDRFISEGEEHQARNWLILVQEILNELLSGVTDPSNPAAKATSDLYVYLIKEAYAVAEKLDRSKLKGIADVLEVEWMTWDIMVKRESGGSGASIPAPLHSQDGDSISIGSLNLQA